MGFEPFISFEGAEEACREWGHRPVRRASRRRGRSSIPAEGVDSVESSEAWRQDLWHGVLDRPRPALTPSSIWAGNMRASLPNARAAVLPGDVIRVCQVIGTSHRHHMNGHHPRHRPGQSYQLRDDAIVPVICPRRVKMVWPRRAKHPCRRTAATLHGVVFDILVGSEGRAVVAGPSSPPPSFGLQRDSLSLLRLALGARAWLAEAREASEGWWGRQDSNLRSHEAADLQSAPFATRDTPPLDDIRSGRLCR